MIERLDLEAVMMGAMSLDELIEKGVEKQKGGRKLLEQLKAILATFTPDFELMPGTKKEATGKSEMKVSAQPELGETDGG